MKLGNVGFYILSYSALQTKLEQKYACIFTSFAQVHPQPHVYAHVLVHAPQAMMGTCLNGS